MGARISRNRHGNLVIRWNWRGIEGWEAAGKDNPTNRKLVERLVEAIDREMRGNRFSSDRYLYYFPCGSKAGMFRASPVLKVGETLDEYLSRHLTRLAAEGRQTNNVRYRVGRTLNVVLPDGRRLGSLPVTDLTTRVLLDTRTALLDRYSVVSAKTMLSGDMRTMVRQLVQVDEVLDVDPYLKLPRWPKVPAPDIDPFTVQERDQILTYLSAKKMHWQFRAVLFLFGTGMRPGEMTGLRWTDVDLRNRNVRVRRSRSRRHEGPPKTPRSTRTIRISESLAGLLQSHYGLSAGPDDAVFTREAGEPIDSDHLGKYFRRALRATGIRQRGIYHCRHTFISFALRDGAAPKWIAEYCGTSCAMIERHYGKFIVADDNVIDNLNTVTSVTQAVTRTDDQSQLLENAG